MSGASFRRILVTVQFTFSVALICGTIIVDRQLAYIHQKELGYDKDHIFRFELRNIASDIQSVKATLITETDWDGKAPDLKFFIHPLTVDKDFFSVFNLNSWKDRTLRGSPPIPPIIY